MESPEGSKAGPLGKRQPFKRGRCREPPYGTVGSAAATPTGPGPSTGAPKKTHPDRQQALFFANWTASERHKPAQRPGVFAPQGAALVPGGKLAHFSDPLFFVFLPTPRTLVLQQALRDSNLYAPPHARTPSTKLLVARRGGSPAPTSRSATHLGQARSLLSSGPAETENFDQLKPALRGFPFLPKRRKHFSFRRARLRRQDRHQSRTTFPTVADDARPLGVKVGKPWPLYPPNGTNNNSNPSTSPPPAKAARPNRKNS